MSFLKDIDGADFVRAVKAGCLLLETKRDHVDALNVFPVPDGDTGTNMYLTLLSAVKESEKNFSTVIGQVSKSVSVGSLMGARGNSGVILSQIFRGLAKSLTNKKTANAKDIAEALQEGANTAYKAVMKPAEGTILTVIREIAKSADKAVTKKNGDIIAVMLESIRTGYAVLEKTPDMLPVLKEAGVVDSGGQGLLFFLEGFVSGLAEENDIKLELYPDSKPASVKNEAPDNITLAFQYCTEVLIKGSNINTYTIKNHLTSLGDSMMVVDGDDLVKVHIHSNHPGQVLETCLRFGELSDIKINNMLEEVHEHRHVLMDNDANGIAAAEPSNQEIATASKNLGVVAVAAGEGIAEIFKSLGVDEIVTGGQTMNPSTQDILAAINKIAADNIIVFPNNSNILMAAEQTRQLSNKHIEIIPTKSVMQAIAVLIEYDPSGDLNEVAKLMKSGIKDVAYAEITAAVRASSANGISIEEGDWLGIVNGEIVTANADMQETITKVLEQIANEDKELITLLFGSDVSQEEAEQVRAHAESQFPEHEVELHYGGQAHYPYLLSAE